MESIIRLLILLLLIAATTTVIACAVIYNRKRQRPTQPAVAEEARPTAAGETKPKVTEEGQPTAVEEPQPIVMEEAEPTPAEEIQPTPVEEAQVRFAPEAQTMVVQEAEPAAKAETKPAAIEEAKPITVEELQPTVAEETQPTVVEKAQLTAPDETKPTVIEEAQPQVAEEVLRKAEGGRRKPEERGGRPRGPAPRREERPIQETGPHRPKPEIVCWKRERQWIVAVEVPEDLFANSGLAVLQNSLPLTQDELRKGRWHLKEAYGQVVVQWNKDEVDTEVKIALGKEGYLLFKLSGQDHNQGRRVKSLSSGSYLAMVPDNWERDEVLSGPPSVTPEPVSLTGYQAHFFELERDGNEKIAFCTPEGKSVAIESKGSQFELVGNRLNDASDNMGPLFGVRPPQIRPRDDQTWEGISTVVVGEEGSGHRRWRTEITLVPETMEQDLPSEVAARKDGWYFLRFYDTNDDLIESLDFRFIGALRDIRVPQQSPIPSEDGYKPVDVIFVHEPSCAVQWADSFTNIRIKSQDDKTILTIPPDPTCDQTRWLVGSEDGPKVEVTILVERLWWAVGGEDKEPSEWNDQPFTLSRDDFAATSKKTLWLRLPRRRWANRIFVGFEWKKARPYDVKVTEKTVSIPLRDFGDTEEVQRVGIVAFNLWFSRQSITYKGTPCRLVVKVGCRTCDFISSSEEGMFHHIESIHLDEFFTPLTYEKVCNLVPSLPSGIYRCSYCNFYVRSDDLTNPTSAIIRHIQKDCPKASGMNGPVHIMFRVISDVDEIRENVIPNLQRIHKCKLCAVHLDGATERDMIHHLVEQHEDMLYELR